MGFTEGHEHTHHPTVCEVGSSCIYKNFVIYAVQHVYFEYAPYILFSIKLLKRIANLSKYMRVFIIIIIIIIKHAYFRNTFMLINAKSSPPLCIKGSFNIHPIHATISYKYR